MKRPTRTPLLLTAITILTIGLSACSAGHPLTDTPGYPYPLTSPPQVGEIFNPATGTLVSEQAMLSIASDNRIVYVGETHDNPASHRQQLDVIKAMADRYPGKLAIGMEMFTPDQQAVLDRWSAGELDEKTFLRESKWFDVWQSDFALYRDILFFARDHRIPVIGLNADREMVRAVGRTPIEELPEAMRDKIPELDLSDPYHTAMVEGIYGDHVKSKGMLDGFQRVQVLWDETMARSVVDFLQSEKGNGFHMVVLAGGNHIRYGFGIPRRVFRQLPTSYTLIGSKEIEIPESRRDQLMNVTLPEFPMPAYDFIAFTRYEELPDDQVKLGVRYEEVEGGPGLRIMAVVPESAADKAGLQDGDILLQFDGEPLTDSFDLVYAIMQKHNGDRVQLRLDRSGKALTTEATLAPLQHH